MIGQPCRHPEESALCSGCRRLGWIDQGLLVQGQGAEDLGAGEGMGLWGREVGLEGASGLKHCWWGRDG